MANCHTLDICVYNVYMSVHITHIFTLNWFFALLILFQKQNKSKHTIWVKKNIQTKIDSIGKYIENCSQKCHVLLHFNVKMYQMTDVECTNVSKSVSFTLGDGWITRAKIIRICLNQNLKMSFWLRSRTSNSFFTKNHL